MLLNKKNIHLISAADVEKPDAGIFSLPEKVLQFGAGVLLRGLPDYYIDKANKQKTFNGRVVIITSTDNTSSEIFEEQDNLYTLVIRGVEDGKVIEQNSINASISRVLSAKNNWNEIMETAAGAELQVIISNTTEVGIQLMNDDVHALPPVSFPGKLLAFLYRRYKIFNGDTAKGFIIIPTELIVDNGNKLKAVLKELAAENKLEASFVTWMEQANEFCNSLVDRIIPGKLQASQQKDAEAKNGYADRLMIMAEPYNLWAIETSSEKTKEILSFSKTDKNIFIVPDISSFRELKLRLLNGAHTLSCGLAHLSGFITVKQAIGNKFFNKYISDLMHNEIAVAIANDSIHIDEAQAFVLKVLDRFRNPFIEHQWLSITLQYSSKMAMRNVVTIQKYFERFKKVPPHMALGFAAYLLFTKPVEVIDGKYYGISNLKKYIIADDKAGYYYELWQKNTAQNIVMKTLGDKELWGIDLLSVTGFKEAVEDKLLLLMKDDVLKVLEETLSEYDSSIFNNKK